MNALLVAGGRDAYGNPVDVRIEDGLVTAVGEGGTTRGDEVLDASGLTEPEAVAA